MIMDNEEDLKCDPNKNDTYVKHYKYNIATKYLGIYSFP